MAALADAMKAGIWFDRPKVEEAEYKYQEYLVRTQTGRNVPVKGVTAPKASENSGSNLSQQIKEVRQKMQDSLKDTPASVGGGGDADALRKQVELLAQENEKLKQEVTKITKRFEAIERRLTAVEGGKSAPNKPADEKPVQNGVKEEEDEDSDIDLFGSDDEEDDEEAERIKAERLKAYQEKKSKKTAVIAKSTIVLDVKPWDDETNMAELEKCVRSIEMDGLLWGASKLVKIAFGILKLQISCVVEDDKVGTDDLEEKICGFEDYVQSMDIVAFNKI
uniref:Elongation factor 1-delta n=1 Tax=Phallusia mammillata TaxID=59560 RepID=A0A6F9DCD5_9ASCI|nr:elongation factor 1-delta [Phallusia mammillata]